MTACMETKNNLVYYEGRLRTIARGYGAYLDPTCQLESNWMIRLGADSSFKLIKPCHILWLQKCALSHAACLTSSELRLTSRCDPILR